MLENVRACSASCVSCNAASKPLSCSCIAYHTVLRRSELAALQVSDLLVDLRGDATLLVCRSKTDAEGRCEIGYIAPDTVALLRAWLESSGVSEGRLFRSIGKGSRIVEVTQRAGQVRRQRITWPPSSVRAGRSRLVAGFRHPHLHR